MKKKFLTLSTVMAILMVLVMPASVLAEGTQVNGEVPSAPTIGLLSPENGNAGATPEVTITGTNFVEGQTTVSISGSGVSAGAVTFDSETQIRCTFTIAADAAGGPRNVKVTVYGFDSNNSMFTVNSFLTITAPSAISLGTMSVGAAGNKNSSLTPGSVATNVASWSVTATDAKETNTGYMTKEGPGALNNKFQIGVEENDYVDADTELEYEANPVSLPFYVKQVVAQNDAAGIYSITITFTGTY